jgi:hypothetical protein
MFGKKTSKELNQSNSLKIKLLSINLTDLVYYETILIIGFFYKMYKISNLKI